LIIIISSYSARREPVTQTLRGVQLDILQVCNHIQDLLLLFRCHRQREEEQCTELFSKAEKLAECLTVHLHLPRQCSRQASRANIYTSTEEKYFYKSIFVLYLDWQISSMEIRFSAESKQSFSLFSLYPKHDANERARMHETC